MVDKTLEAFPVVWIYSKRWARVPGSSFSQCMVKASNTQATISEVSSSHSAGSSFFRDTRESSASQRPRVLRRDELV